MDRILAVEPGAETYDVPADLDPVQQVTRSLAAVPYAHEVEVVLETSLEEARRRIPSSIATLAEVDGGVLLRTRAERLGGMARMLAGLGWSFVIHHPDELRTAVRDLSAEIAAQADRH